MQFRNVRSGFTLLEIVLAMGIIGTLSSIVLVAINPAGQVDASLDAAQKINARDLQKALFDYSLFVGVPLAAGIPTGQTWFDAVPVCREGGATTNCANLLPLVTAGYLSALPPPDPREPIADFLGLQVVRDEAGLDQVYPTLFPSETLSLPTVVTLQPTNNATDIDIETTEVSLQFSDNMQAGAGRIFLRSGGSIVETIDAADTEISGATVTISLATELEPETGYSLQIERNAFHNGQANFLGIYDDATWYFATGEDAAPFAPSDIADLDLWLDANDASTVFESTNTSDSAEVGDTIGYWTDKSGNANHVIETSATLRPKWSQTGSLAGTANKTVNFDGSNDRLRNLAAIGLDNVPTYTFYIVMNRTFTSNNRDPIEVAEGATFIWRIRAVSINTNIGFSALHNIFTGGTRSWGNLGVFYTRKATYDGTNIRWYWSATNDTDPATGAMYNGGTITLTLGDSATGAAWAGHIGEILFYGRNLTGAEQTQIESYLNTKWGV